MPKFSECAAFELHLAANRPSDRLRSKCDNLYVRHRSSVTATLIKSVSQFNREYRRFFGQPAKWDIKALRATSVIAA